MRLLKLPVKLSEDEAAVQFEMHRRCDAVRSGVAKTQAPDNSLGACRILHEKEAGVHNMPNESESLKAPELDEAKTSRIRGGLKPSTGFL